jgi:hypothetical protein
VSFSDDDRHVRAWAQGAADLGIGGNDWDTVAAAIGADQELELPRAVLEQVPTGPSE